MVKASQWTAADEDEAESQPTQSRNPKSSKAAKQSRSAEDDLGSDEDPGHTKTQHFLAITKKSSEKKGAFVLDFTAALDKHQEEACEGFDEIADNITAKNYQLHAAVISNLSKSLRNSHDKGTAAKEGPNTAPDAQFIHQNAMSLIQSSKNLLSVYTQVSQQATSGESARPQGSKWDEAGEKLQGLLNRQGKRIQAEIQELVQGEVSPAKVATDAASFDQDDELWNRYAIGHLKDGEVKARAQDGLVWAKVARQMHRGVGRLVKHLPEDDY